MTLTFPLLPTFPMDSFQWLTPAPCLAPLVVYIVACLCHVLWVVIVAVVAQCLIGPWRLMYLCFSQMCLVLVIRYLVIFHLPQFHPLWFLLWVLLDSVAELDLERLTEVWTLTRYDFWWHGYLSQWREEALEVRGQLAESSCLFLGFALSTDLYQGGQAGLEPTQIPLLVLRFMSKLLQQQWG